MQTDQEQHSLWVHKLFEYICNINIKKNSKASLCESCCFAFYQWSFLSEGLAPDAKVSGLCRTNQVTQRVPPPHSLIFLHSVIFSVSGKSSSQANISPGYFEFVLVQHKGFLVINIFTTGLLGISLNCFVFSRDQWTHWQVKILRWDCAVWSDEILNVSLRLLCHLRRQCGTTRRCWGYVGHAKKEGRKIFCAWTESGVEGGISEVLRDGLSSAFTWTKETEWQPGVT